MPRKKTRYLVGARNPSVGVSTQAFEPHKYQVDAITHLLENPYAALFLNPGLGKTAITLQAFRILWMNNAATRALVIAPLRVIHNVWPGEIEKWENFQNISYSILHGPKKNDAVYANKDLYLINPEGIPWLATTDLWKRVDMLIVDESSMWKNHNTRRFRSIKPFLKDFRRRVILTGTPTPNGMMQLWSQMFLVDGGLRLEQFITRYRRRYFYQTRYSTHSTYELMEDGMQRIYERIGDIVLHRSNDVLDLPELVNNEIVVELPEDAKEQYDTLKRDSYIELSGGGATALNAGAKTNKLKQLSGGGLYDDDGNAEWVHDAKIDALRELVSEHQGQPVLVFYQFKHELERLREVFQAPYLGGGVGSAESKKIIKAWNKDEIPILLLHPAAGGHGLNLQQGTCATAVWFSIPWDAEHYEQATARLWRQGQKQTVVLHHIVAKGTVDRHVIRALRGKVDLQKTLLNVLKGDVDAETSRQEGV